MNRREVLANGKMTGDTTRCSFCGTVLGSAPFARQGRAYCCEGCFLKQQEFTAVELALAEAQQALPEVLVAALDAREHETGLHSKRVACHTLVLAQRLTTDGEQLRQVYWGALLHDIGKIAIPDALLLKPGPLSAEEWAQMRTHPAKGAELLASIPYLTGAADIVMSHEERFDGSGYPHGLVGEAIPWGARVFALVDTLDAVTSDRSYRKGRSFEEAKAEILRGSGIQFDPLAVEAFLAEEEALRRMVAMKCSKAPFASGMSARRL